MTPRYHSTRPPSDITGIRRSGLTWAQINGRLEPMEGRGTGRLWFWLAGAVVVIVLGVVF